jgi:hypothetical protein
MERKIHGLLKSSSNIFQTKRHLQIGECTPWTNERSFVLVFGLDLYLIVSLKTIHERKGLAICAFINNLVDKWSGEIILWTCLVQIMKVCTYANRTLFFVDWNRICHPLSQLDRVDKTCFDQFLYFNLNSCCFLRIDGMKLLPDWLSIRICHDFVFDDCWIYAQNFLVRRGKHIVEFFK